MDSDEDIEIIEETYVEKSEIKNIKNIYNVSKGTGKIEYDLNGYINLGSCTLLKLERNKKPFFCIMTNDHVIREAIENEKEITLKYDNEKETLSFKLNKEERIIKSFMDKNIDIIVIEIIPKDKIKESFFLSPKTNIKEESTINKIIQIIQHPNGEDLSLSEGKITEIYRSLFFHEASTLSGSSGSPIVLENEEEVIAIHRGSLGGGGKNVGLFIGGVVDILKNYERNGFYKEYYENGDLKYEGKFLNDEYNDDNGKYIDKEGYVYQGKFEKGKKNGKFKKIKDGDEIECEFKDDKILDVNEDKPVFTNDGDRTGLKFWQNIGMDIFHYLKPLGDDINYECGCGHVSKSHTEKRKGVWTCSECPENNNICKFCGAE